MCKYFSYFLAVWGLGLGTFYAYMLYDVINSIRGLSGPLGAFQSLMGSPGLAGMASMSGMGSSPKPEAILPNDNLGSSTDAIYQLINKNFEDENKREQYLREFLPDVGLEEKHYKEMNSIMEGFQFEKLQDYLIDLENYMNENVKSAEVRKKALAKLEEFKANTVDIDQSIGRLASHIMNEEL